MQKKLHKSNRNKNPLFRALFPDKIMNVSLKGEEVGRYMLNSRRDRCVCCCIGRWGDIKTTSEITKERESKMDNEKKGVKHRLPPPSPCPRYGSGRKKCGTNGVCALDKGVLWTRGGGWYLCDVLRSLAHPP